MSFCDVCNCGLYVYVIICIYIYDQIWDVAAESCVPLQRVGGGGVTFLSWSPDGGHVMSSTPSALFRSVCRSQNS